MTFATPSTVLLPCPKCAAPMRTLERSGIHIETCPECRGVFLDRGELDRLLDMEATPPSGDRGSFDPRGTVPAQDPRRAGWNGRGRDDDDDDDDRDDRDDRYRDRDDRYGHRRDQWDGDRPRRGSRRGGFLNDLFENIGG